MGRTVLLIAFVFYACCSFAQNDSALKKKYGLKKTVISPGFNYHLQISQLDISPTLSIKSRRRLQPGLGLNYLYYYRNSRKGKSSWGANLFTRYFCSRYIFMHVEYLYCSVPDINKSGNEYSRGGKNDWFLGIGYQQPITDSVDSYLTLLVNANNTSASAYKNLILLRASISF